MQDPCLFCGHEKFNLVAENALSYAIWDKYPVTALHTLIVSKKHYRTAFELPPSELVSIFELAKICREKITKDDGAVQGFNFGSNSGQVAGQKFPHVHFHLIPRRVGDIEPPPANP